jgi:hypothetical protein
MSAVEGFRHLSLLRAEDAAAVPGTQTVYPPGEGPHMGSTQAHGLLGERDDPLRSALDAFREESKRITAGKT